MAAGRDPAILPMRSPARARRFEWMLAALLDLATASPWAYVALAVMAALDVLVLVIPSESALISAGVLAASGELDLALVVGSAALGAFAGDNCAYALGRLAGRRLEPVLARSGSLTARRAWAERQLEARAPLLLLVARFVPAGRTAVTLAAGSAGLRWRRFARLSALAGTAWAGFAVSLGFVGGSTFAARSWLGLALGLVLGLTVPAALAAAVRLVRGALGDGIGDPTDASRWRRPHGRAR